MSIAGGVAVSAKRECPVFNLVRLGGDPVIAKLAISAIVEAIREGVMQTLSAKEAKYEFGRLIDLARASPVVVAKHGRPVVVVMSVEEFERLTARDQGGDVSGKCLGKTGTT